MHSIKIIALILCLLSAPLLAAEAEPFSDAESLFNSWGFDLTTNGTLVFNSDHEQSPDYQPWNPDLSTFQRTSPAKKPPVVLEPLIISAKSKTKDQE